MTRNLPVVLFASLALLAQPASAKKKAPEPRPCPIDETIRVASLESFSRLESLAGCQDNVEEAMADPEEELESLPAPVRLRPGIYLPVLSSADDAEDMEAPLPGRKAQKDRRMRVSNAPGRTPSVSIVPPREEMPDFGAAIGQSTLTSAPQGTSGQGAEAILSERPARVQSAHDDMITQIAWRHRVDPLLLHAVIKQESGYRQGITSHAGARGLMQIMPGTGQQLGVASSTHLYDPMTNVDAGARLLRKLAIRYNGDFTLVLAAYNAGEGAVAKYGNKVPPYRETQNYVRAVMAHYNRFVAEQPGGANLN